MTHHREIPEAVKEHQKEIYSLKKSTTYQPEAVMDQCSRYGRGHILFDRRLRGQREQATKLLNDLEMVEDQARRQIDPSYK